jgi:hypothetical protein
MTLNKTCAVLPPANHFSISLQSKNSTCSAGKVTGGKNARVIFKKCF